MSFPPPLGGQAPLPAPEGGAEPSGKEASPVRAAPAPALGPKPAPEPAATTALGYPPSLADAQAHALASALSLSLSTSSSLDTPLTEAHLGASIGAEDAAGIPAKKVGQARCLPGQTITGVPLAAASRD